MKKKPEEHYSMSLHKYYEVYFVCWNCGFKNHDETVTYNDCWIGKGMVYYPTKCSKCKSKVMVTMTNAEIARQDNTGQFHLCFYQKREDNELERPKT